MSIYVLDVCILVGCLATIINNSILQLTFTFGAGIFYTIVILFNTIQIPVTMPPARLTTKRPRLEQLPRSGSGYKMLAIFAGGSQLADMTEIARALTEEIPAATPTAVKCIASLGASGRQPSHEERDAHRWLHNLWNSGLDKYLLSAYLCLTNTDVMYLDLRPGLNKLSTNGSIGVVIPSIYF